ncbi:ASCH domain-containing protein [Pseudooceanicola nanhaiensis]|uniref:ASCH domain-containing protein n=1 Tax=Pseudooceanicola nanhaiensis TaxID=375761 RepID=UPI00405A284D
MTPVSFRFGDSERLCTELTALVRAGRKTATCERATAFGPGRETLPQVGRRDIALNWDGSPAVEIETRSVDFRRFDEVDADFALAEGENDSLEGWRADHRAYFERTGGWSPDMMLMCERFRVIRDFEKE